MDTLPVDLTAALVGHSATPSNRTKVETNLQNSTGRLIIEDIEEAKEVPRSAHRITVKDAAEVGCGSPYNLSAHQAARILATSLSLTSAGILFSLLTHDQSQPSLMRGKNIQIENTPIGPKIDITLTMERPSVSFCLGTKVVLDEAQIFDVVSKLLAIRPFDVSKRRVEDLNILDALKRYREASMSADALSCYRSLYSALEKTVNAYGERKGKCFDSAASALTGLTGNEIENLRNFNNRVKHALRNNKDVIDLQAGESKLSQLSQNLKKAADIAILAELKKRIKGHIV